MTQQQFINTIAPIAQQDMIETGVLASITIAKACLDSGFGTSELAGQANNLFNMKASLPNAVWNSEWAGIRKAFQTKQTDERGVAYFLQQDYRIYDSFQESIRDHSDALISTRQGDHFCYERIQGEKNYKQVLQILKEGGAIDGETCRHLQQLIERHQLTQYDWAGARSGLHICLDISCEGEYQDLTPTGDDNQNVMWKLHLLQKKYLEDYGITVVLTRTDFNEEIEAYERGLRSKGCDLLISNAANHSDNPNWDEVLVAYPLNFNGKGIETTLASCISQVMGTKQATKVENRSLPVLRGAAAVGTPALLLQHSYITNPAVRQWLLNDQNLERLAKAEADCIADSYGWTAPSAITQSGWVEEHGGRRFYLGDTGAYVKNAWYQDAGHWYWFDGAGRMISDTWYEYQGKWYYFNPDGTMANNQWIFWNNDRELYWLTEDGSMFRGRMMVKPDERGALKPQLYTDTTLDVAKYQKLVNWTGQGTYPGAVKAASGYHRRNVEL